MVNLKPQDQEIQVSPTVNYRRFQFKHLSLFIFGSAIVHGLLLLLLVRYEADRPVPKSTASKPIDFVVIPPEEPIETPAPEPEPTPQATVEPPAPEPVPEPVPEPKPTPPVATAPAPEPAPESQPQDLITGSEQPTPAPAAKPEAQPQQSESPVATRLPPEPEPPAGGSASDLLGGNYQKTLADGGDAFFSPEALSFQSVLNPEQITALKDFDLQGYGKKVQEQTRPHWRPDPYSPEEYTTVLTFNILPNGQVTELQVSQSSGSAEFDRIALNAIKNATPFAPLPADFPLESLPFQFSFNLYQY